MKPLLVIAHEATRTGSPRVLRDVLRHTRDQLGCPIAVELLAGGPLAADLRGIADAPSTGIDPAVVLINSSLAAGEALRFAPEVPVVAYVHEQGEALQNLPPSAVEGLVTRCDVVLSVSAEARADLVAMGVAAADVHVLAPMIADTGLPSDDEVRAARESVGCRPEDLVVLGCGEATWRKGADLFLDVARRLAPRQDLVFVWVGRRPRGFARVLDHDTRRLGLHDRLHWVGEVDDPRPWLRAAGVLVLPSREDPQPLVPLETALQGTATVGLATGGMSVLAEVGAVLAAPYPDTMLLADHATTVLSDGRIAERLVAESLERVRTVHSIEVIGPRFVEVLRGLMAARGGRRSSSGSEPAT